MPTQHEIPFKPTNQIWRTYKHFPYKAWVAIGELVDNSTQSFFYNRAVLEENLKERGVSFAVILTLDTKARKLTVLDNAMGMDLTELKRAVQLASPPPDTTGRCEFGMGLKTACSWLGDRWSVRTKKYGVPYEFSFEVDIASHAASSDESLIVTEKEVEDVDAHYTIVTVENVRGDVLQGRTVGKIKRYLAEMYRRDIADGSVLLYWDEQRLEPPNIDVLTTTFDVDDGNGGTTSESREWKKPVSFMVRMDLDSNEERPVTGWICLVAPPGGRSKAGFNLIRRGRVIIGRPSGFRPERIFGEARNDLINQRLYGELNLDDFPVNHLKDDFLWDTWGEDFEEKLQAECAEYVKKARETKGKKVPETIVQAANDDIAEALNTEELADRISLLESVGPSPVPSTAQQQAEAEVLRNQPFEARIVEHLGKTYRIYHPQGMLAEQAYVKYEGPEPNTIDIFINDNHPHVGAISDRPGAAEKYQMHTLQCVVDAITAHLVAGLGRPVDPALFLQYKDQLMRVLKA